MRAWKRLAYLKALMDARSRQGAGIIADPILRLIRFMSPLVILWQWSHAARR